MMEEALASYKEAVGIQASDTLYLVRNYSQVLFALGERPKALQLVQETLFVIERDQGKEDRDTIGLASTYAHLLKAAQGTPAGDGHSSADEITAKYKLG